MMTRNHFRLFLTFTFCGIAAAGALWFPAELSSQRAGAAEEKEGAKTQSLSIGSPAPPLDIEHWVQDGKGFFSPVTKLEKDKVYVVEFWATWCPPCVASMPHLASVQQKYRGRNVQIVSVSDEPLETVQTFLEREAETDEGDKTTFAEITSAYCLTTDPDRSVYTAYMEASQQQGIPTAFIVGKSGLVEWVGHPMEMDEPLEQVVTDKWDRVAFKTMYEANRKFDEVLQQISVLAGSGKYEEAIEVIDSQINGGVPDEIKDKWITIRQRVKLSAGMIDSEVVDYFKQDLAQNKGDAIGVARIGWMLYQASREQDNLGELLTAAIAAITPEVEGAKEDEKPLLLDTLAHLHEATDNVDAAIEAQ
ncbi:MAG: TlpA family protein disulfide reductase, partial [Planctomycetaceae bacterium]